MTAELYRQARQFIPGGVNSPVRAFGAVGGTPIFISSAAGAYLVAADGQRYLDYVGSWGPMILGHAHPAVIRAVTETAALGLSFGAPTILENRLAEKVCSLVPSMERVRMVNSGTEATMSAIRLARGATGRELLVKFAGCYHGHADSLLVKAGSGALTFGVPSSPGVPAAVAATTLTLPFNDSQAVKDLFAARGDDIACLIVEPVAGNMNMIPPSPGFLETLRECCTKAGALLIFDEVMTGFRVALGGAQAHFKVRPDLTTLGKIIGGGMPVGAFGGSAEIMAQLAPDGPVYQAGTLSGNPVAMAAGLATLELISVDGFYEALSANTRRLAEGLSEAGQQAGVPLQCHALGGMFGFVFSPQSPRNLDDVSAADTGLFSKFFHAMLGAGIYLAPSAFEAGFVSAAHTRDDIDRTLNAARRSLQQIT